MTLPPSDVTRLGQLLEKRRETRVAQLSWSFETLPRKSPIREPGAKKWPTGPHTGRGWRQCMAPTCRDIDWADHAWVGLVFVAMLVDVVDVAAAVGPKQQIP
jgi:hypothetical protein